MALLAETSIAAQGRSQDTLTEHAAIVAAIAAGEGEAADQALRDHISRAFATRLRLDAKGAEARGT
jgi:DNA-binding GntR family transcriptional regulator